MPRFSPLCCTRSASEAVDFEQRRIVNALSCGREEHEEYQSMLRSQDRGDYLQYEYTGDSADLFRPQHEERQPRSRTGLLAGVCAAILMSVAASSYILTRAPLTETETPATEPSERRAQVLILRSTTHGPEVDVGTTSAPQLRAPVYVCDDLTDLSDRKTQYCCGRYGKLCDVGLAAAAAQAQASATEVWPPSPSESVAAPPAPAPAPASGDVASEGDLDWVQPAYPAASGAASEESFVDVVDSAVVVDDAMSPAAASGSSGAEWASAGNPGSCAQFGCTEHFLQDQNCQCNEKCEEFQNCCPDRYDVCVLLATAELEAMAKGVPAKEAMQQSSQQIAESPSSQAGSEQTLEFSANPVVLSEPFDCRLGLDNWEETWPLKKVEYCCKKMPELGCEFTTTETTTVTTTSAQEVPKKEAEPKIATSVATTEETVKLGLVVPPPPGVEVNCSEGVLDWERGWSDMKKAWCCQREGTGCKPSTPSTSGTSSAATTEEKEAETSSEAASTSAAAAPSSTKGSEQDVTTTTAAASSSTSSSSSTMNPETEWLHPPKVEVKPIVVSEDAGEEHPKAHRGEFLGVSGGDAVVP